MVTDAAWLERAPDGTSLGPGDGVGEPDRPARFLAWRDHWTLHVDFMDEDHRYLAERLNRIAERFGVALAERPAPAPEALQEALTTLGRDARTHFAREEKVMRETGYPGLPAHKSEHDLLLAELTDLVRRLRAGAACTLDDETLDGLKTWLLGHLLNDDRQLADFILSRGR